MPEFDCRRIDSVRRIEVLEATILRGEGVPGDPARTVTQYWSMAGELLAERDAFKQGA